MNELAVSASRRVIASELLPVYETNSGEKVIDARELHSFLQVGRDFTTWFKDRVQKYGFVEGEDFSPVSGKSSGGRPTVEYILKLDAAKEFCMVENNEQGSQARKYFIEIEKRFKQQTLDVSKLSPEMQMFHHVFQSVAKTQLELVETQKQLAEVTQTVEVIQDTILKRDDDWRKSINSMLNGAAYRSESEYRTLRSESYRILEERAHCDLDKRLRNLTKRLEESGATKTQIKEANRMDVIESDPKLKEIYTTVVKEISIGSLRQVK